MLFGENARSAGNPGSLNLENQKGQGQGQGQGNHSKKIRIKKDLFFARLVVFD